ncbi:MAG TPA: alpha/beta hydrolase [Anaerolineaceae bacterium]|nr:alpha/beta hydrolase [Anaerolineaceae bacterium]
MWIGLGIVGFAIVVYFGVGALAANQLTRPVRRFDPTNHPGMRGLVYEEVTYPSRAEDVHIAAWYIPTKESKRAVILVPGRDDSRTKGFDEHFVDFAAALQRAGLTVLMIDLRGHGQSGDGRYTFGLKEREDVIGGVEWLKGRGFRGGQIGVLGYSLGSAACIGAAADDPEIGAIVSESGYAEIRSLVESRWVQESHLPQIFLDATRLMGKAMFGYDILSSRPVDEIARIAPRPILLIHSTTDEYISFSHHFPQLQAAAPWAQVWVVEGAKHGMIYNFNPDLYVQEVVDFFCKNLA